MASRYSGEWQEQIDVSRGCRTPVCEDTTVIAINGITSDGASMVALL